MLPTDDEARVTARRAQQAYRDAWKDALQDVVREMRSGREIVASSDCAHCGKPVVRQRRATIGSDGWLHLHDDGQRATFCYQPPVATPVAGWDD